MIPIAQTRDARIEAVDVSAYSVRTSTEQESDGTLIWDSTTIVVVEVSCGGHIGLGYSYCHPSAGQVITSKLASVLEGADPLAPEDVVRDADAIAPDRPHWDRGDGDLGGRRRAVGPQGEAA